MGRPRGGLLLRVREQRAPIIAISITAEAYWAIRATLPEGSDSFPPQPDGRGDVRLWLDRKFVDRLAQMRGPGESYSDVILRRAGETS